MNFPPNEELNLSLLTATLKFARRASRVVTKAERGTVSVPRTLCVVNRTVSDTLYPFLPPLLRSRSRPTSRSSSCTRTRSLLSELNSPLSRFPLSVTRQIPMTAVTVRTGRSSSPRSRGLRMLNRKWPRCVHLLLFLLFSQLTFFFLDGFTVRAGGVPTGAETNEASESDPRHVSLRVAVLSPPLVESLTRFSSILQLRVHPSKRGLRLFFQWVSSRAFSIKTTSDQ